MKKIKLVNDTKTAWGHKKMTIEKVKYENEFDCYRIVAKDRFGGMYLFYSADKVEIGEKHIVAFDETASWAEIDDKFEIVMKGEEVNENV